MNAVSMLIGVTALILVGVFAFSFGSMKIGSSANIHEKEKLRTELSLLQQTSIVDYSPQKDIDTREEMNALKSELDTLKTEKLQEEKARLAEEQARLQAKQNEAEEAQEVIEPEMDPNDKKRLERRAKLISQAMVMATVEKYYPQDQFAAINVINYENVQSGVTLAIRRNTGIVGQLKVSTVESEKAIADVMYYTFLGGEIDIQPGDELILPPL